MNKEHTENSNINYAKISAKTQITRIAFRASSIKHRGSKGKSYRSQTDIPITF